MGFLRSFCILTAPTISLVTIVSTPTQMSEPGRTAPDTNIHGDTIAVEVTYSEAVTVTGGNNNVRLRLDVVADDAKRANNRKVLMLKRVSDATLRFEHTVMVSDSDADEGRGPAGPTRCGAPR